jgi:hypothetical protein
LCINDENPKSGLLKVRKRQFSEEMIEEFKYLGTSWQDALLNSEINVRFNAFMDMVRYCLNISFSTI